MTYPLERLQAMPIWVRAAEVRELFPRGQRPKVTQLISAGVVRALKQDGVLWLSREDLVYATTCRRDRKTPLSHAMRGTVPLSCAELDGYGLYQWVLEQGHELGLPAPPFTPPSVEMRAARRLAGLEDRVAQLEGFVTNLFHAVHQPARLRTLSDDQVFDLLEQTYVALHADRVQLDTVEGWFKTLAGLTPDHLSGLETWATRYPTETQELCGKMPPYMLLLQLAHKLRHYLTALGEGGKDTALERLQLSATRAWEHVNQLCQVQMTLRHRLARTATLPVGVSDTERYLLEHL